MSETISVEAATVTTGTGSDFSTAPWPTVRRVLEVFGWSMVALLVFTGLSVVLLRAGFMAQNLGAAGAELIETDPFNGRYIKHTVATWLHLIPGFLVMVLGPMQFMRWIRNRWTKFHRMCGRVFIIAAGIGGASGVIIGVFDPFMGVGGQGFNESMATAFFSAYVLFCLVMAYRRIRQRKFGQHREWMVRSFALLLGIATERLKLTALQINTDIDMAVLFGTTFWMAITANMAAAEIWINLTRTPGNGARHWKDVDAKARAG